MSLLPGSTITSLEAKKAAQKVIIDAIIKNIWHAMAIGQQDGIDQFWRSPLGLTPQQVADAYGTDAGKLFAFHGALTEFIVAQAAVENLTPPIKLPTNAFTVNHDGTVTVLETPYTP